MNKPDYSEKHCQKHNQDYADFLTECPVCAGEKMKKPIEIDRGTANSDWIKPKKFKRKEK